MFLGIVFCGVFELPLPLPRNAQKSDKQIEEELGVDFLSICFVKSSVIPRYNEFDLLLYCSVYLCRYLCRELCTFSARYSRGHGGGQTQNSAGGWLDLVKDGSFACRLLVLAVGGRWTAE
jgi:hypothetical protein